jgi:hypothetical protein
MAPFWLRLAAALLLGWQVLMFGGLAVLIGFLASLSGRDISTDFGLAAFYLAPLLAMLAVLAAAVLAGRWLYRWLSAGSAGRAWWSFGLLLLVTVAGLPTPFAFVYLGG